MAIPFRDYSQSDKPEKKENSAQKENNRKENNLCSGICNQTARSLQLPQSSVDFAQGTAVSTNVYCILNSSFFNCGPTFIKEFSSKNKLEKAPTSLKEKVDPGCKIKVRKGIFTSHRTITSEDIKVVAENVEWKKLVRKLPGVTSDNLIFHQAFVDAMDRNENRSMSEIALFTWKCVLPEFSTIGNLSKTLFTIGHPDVVTHLKP